MDTIEFGNSRPRRRATVIAGLVAVLVLGAAGTTAVAGYGDDGPLRLEPAARPVAQTSSPADVGGVPRASCWTPPFPTPVRNGTSESRARWQYRRYVLTHQFDAPESLKR